MSRPVLVLVTGSRALAGHDDARVWLREQLAALAPAVVVTGNAQGPDDEAAAWARDAGVPLRRYDGRGRITDGAATVARWEAPASMPSADAGRAQWAAWYLHRDRVMVRHVAARADRYTVTGLALFAPSSETEGTAFTVARAKVAGLDIVGRKFDRAPTLPGVGR